MAWLDKLKGHKGKIVGAGIGGFIGGPIGIAIGAWIGGTFDGNRNTREVKQIEFIVTVFSMLAKMAKADGVVTKDEIQAVEGFMNHIRLNDNDKQEAKKIFKNAINDEYDIYAYANQYSSLADKTMREVVYAMLWQVTMADGEFHPAEDEILRKITKNLNINNAFYEEYKSQITGATQGVALDTHYQLLSCKASDSDEVIKRSYKKTISKYHPDKIQAQGLPKEFIEIANEQSKKINEAYEVIKKSRNL